MFENVKTFDTYRKIFLVNASERKKKQPTKNVAKFIFVLNLIFTFPIPLVKYKLIVIMANFCIVFLLTVLVCGVHSWDNEELEIFDLVEEINQNFYTVLGIQQVHY